MFYYLRSIIAYIIIILFLLDVALYLAGIPEDYQPHSVPTQFQSTSGMKSAYTNRRSESIDFIYDGNPRGYFRNNNTVQHVTNAVGFRGPEILREKPKNTYRIVFLGDSITFGEGVYFEDTYPEQFKVLAQKQDMFNGKIVESINAGVGGFNTRDEYTLLQDVIEFYKIRPDRVIIGYSLNDADQPLFKVDTDVEFMRIPNDLENFVASAKSTPAVFEIFKTFQILRNWYVNKIITEKTVSYYRMAYQDSNPSWLETKKAINDFGAFQKTTGIPITFIIFPTLFRLSDYPFVEEQNKVIKELADNGIEYVSLLPFLSGYKNSELWVHPTDQHPNEILHRIAAETLAGQLSK